MPRGKKITQEEIEFICRAYYLSEASIADVARQFHRSDATIRKILDFHGGAFCNSNKEEIFEWRRNRK